MQSAADLAQRLRVLSLYKNLYKNLRIVQPSLQPQNDQLVIQKSNHAFLRNEFRQNSVSDSRYCMEKNEMFFMANAYLTYLQSTKATLDLYAKYCKGERSIESSANLVGLKLPKLYQENESDSDGNKAK
jgi:hypothetical protein